MKTITPKKITKPMNRLMAKVAPGQKHVYLKAQPGAGARINECFSNVQDRISIAGGSMLCGWQIWEWPHVMIEAEFHAVWVAPNGSVTEVTPKEHGEDTILFVPNPSLIYTGSSKDNVRVAVRDDLLVHHFIRASEEIVKVKSRGRPTGTDGQVSVPANEINPLIKMQKDLGEAIYSGLRDHNFCFCGSGHKYKKCHGQNFPLR